MVRILTFKLKAVLHMICVAFKNHHPSRGRLSLSARITQQPGQSARFSSTSIVRCSSNNRCSQQQLNLGHLMAPSVSSISSSHAKSLQRQALKMAILASEKHGTRIMKYMHWKYNGKLYYYVRVHCMPSRHLQQFNAPLVLTIWYSGLSCWLGLRKEKQRYC